MASRMLCITIRVVSFSCPINFSVKASTLAAVLGSRAAVCSSKSKSFGRFRIAISSVTACRWPPESMPTLTFRRFSKPSSSRLNSVLYNSRSLPEMPHFSVRLCPRRKASAMFSSSHILAAVPSIGSWKTRPRIPARLCSGSLVTSLPSIRMEPESTSCSPAMQLSKVDLPAPLPPIKVTKSPSFRWRFTLCKAVFSFTVPLLKVLKTPFTASIFRSPFQTGHNGPQV